MPRNETLAKVVEENDGVLPLEPAFVARDWLPAGRRLGLAEDEDEYELGDRGTVAERWLASTTHADNAVGPDDEGQSSIRTSEGPLNLAVAVADDPELILGAAYAAGHRGLGRLAKIYDYAARIPFHVHPPIEQAAKVGRNSKDEAYYFPEGVPMGAHPETFFGLHPGMRGDDAARRALLGELEAWDSDTILRFSRAFQQLPEDGFFLPSGVLHAPGTALTIELQEDSDTLAMFQALNAGVIIDKDQLLFKDVSVADRQDKGEAALLDWLDWEANCDPYFYENHHIPPVTFAESDGASEAWIFYGSHKFSGKRLRLAPGARYTCSENGVFSLLVWQGEGEIGGHGVSGGRPGADELLVIHRRAVEPLTYVNTGGTELVVVKFFGPDLNPGAPTLPSVGGTRR